MVAGDKNGNGGLSFTEVIKYSYEIPGSDGLCFIENQDMKEVSIHS
jgi:hypothetical protein